MNNTTLNRTSFFYYKEFVSFKENDQKWEIVRLDPFQRLLRYIFGAYSETHLKSLSTTNFRTIIQNNVNHPLYDVVRKIYNKAIQRFNPYLKPLKPNANLPVPDTSDNKPQKNDIDAPFRKLPPPPQQPRKDPQTPELEANPTISTDHKIIEDSKPSAPVEKNPPKPSEPELQETDPDFLYRDIVEFQNKFRERLDSKNNQKQKFLILTLKKIMDRSLIQNTLESEKRIDLLSYLFRETKNHPDEIPHLVHELKGQYKDSLISILKDVDNLSLLTFMKEIIHTELFVKILSDEKLLISVYGSQNETLVSKIREAPLLHSELLTYILRKYFNELTNSDNPDALTNFVNEMSFLKIEWFSSFVLKNKESLRKLAFINDHFEILNNSNSEKFCYIFSLTPKERFSSLIKEFRFKNSPPSIENEINFLNLFFSLIKNKETKDLFANLLCENINYILSNYTVNGQNQIINELFKIDTDLQDIARYYEDSPPDYCNMTTYINGEFRIDPPEDNDPLSYCLYQYATKKLLYTYSYENNSYSKWKFLQEVEQEELRLILSRAFANYLRQREKLRQRCRIEC